LWHIDCTRRFEKQQNAKGEDNMKKRLVRTLTAAVAIFGLISSGVAFAAPLTSLQTTQRTQLLSDVVPGNQGIIDAYCQTGEVVTGGGFRWGEWQTDVQDMALFIGQNAEVVSSSRYFSPQYGYGWRVVVLNTSETMNIDIEADVICAKLVTK
jgi:hypothetical protein